MKTYPSKETQQAMFDFFMRTSAPRLVQKAKEEKKKDCPNISSPPDHLPQE